MVFTENSIKSDQPYHFCITITVNCIRESGCYVLCAIANESGLHVLRLSSLVTCISRQISQIANPVTFDMQLAWLLNRD
jgi:hypothetical protein